MRNRRFLFFLYFYTPAEQLEKIKAALFKAGAGRLGDYQECCWETEGLGQFRPLKGSKPHLGKQDELSRVKEIKVEMVCHRSCRKKIVKALLENHPYETPAYGFIKIRN